VGALKKSKDSIEIKDQKLYEANKEKLDKIIQDLGGVPKDFDLLSYNNERSEHEHYLKYESLQFLKSGKKPTNVTNVRGNKI